MRVIFLGLIVSIGVLSTACFAQNSEIIKTTQTGPNYTYKVYTQDGESVYVETFKPNRRTGELERVKTKGYIPDGVVREQTSPTSYRTWTYKQGKKTGPFALYKKYTNAYQVIESGTLKKGKREGVFSFYTHEGILKRHEYFEDDHRVKQEDFYPSGALKRRYTFNAEARVQTMLEYAIDGPLIREKDNDKLTETYYNPKGVVRSEYSFYPNLTLKKMRHHTPKSKQGFRAAYDEDGFMTLYQVPHQPRFNRSVIDSKARTNPYLLTHLIAPNMSVSQLEALFISQGKETGQIAIRAYREAPSRTGHFELTYQDFILNQPATVVLNFKFYKIDSIHYSFIEQKHIVEPRYKQLKTVLLHYFGEPKKTKKSMVSWDTMALKATLKLEPYGPYYRWRVGIYNRSLSSIMRKSGPSDF